jgi:hypothetical protein
MEILRKLAARAEQETGLPGRFMLPAGIAGLGLNVAVLGMYWDIGYHVDHGRDANPITVPHMLIVSGIQLIVIAALVHGILPGPKARGERRLPLGLSLSPGGLQVLLCGGFALLGFPLDIIWHALFGEDVTLWGPTHMLMIVGAGMSTLGVWMLLRHALELGDERRRGFGRKAQLRIAGGLLIGLSTVQAEFDFGVPQFQLLFQPILIALAAGMGLVAARAMLGRGGALLALGMFFAVRGGLALLVGPLLGHTTPHFPLYVVEALIVEAAFLAAPRSPARAALLSGAGIGTLGLAAEWGFSHVWMRHPWTASMLPTAVILSLAAAIGGALVGARIAGALATPSRPLAIVPAPAVAAAGLAILVALAYPLPRSGGDGTSATLVPTPAGHGEVNVAVTLQPPRAAQDAEWFEVLSWQGRQRLRNTKLRQVAPGRFVSTEPIPVDGNWNSLLRLAHGPHLMAMPVRQHAVPQSHRPEVPVQRRSGALTSETFQLQREATGGPGWLTTAAYSLLAGVAAGWIALSAWSLRLAQGPRRRREEGAPRPAVATT